MHVHVLTVYKYTDLLRHANIALTPYKQARSSPKEITEKNIIKVIIKTNCTMLLIKCDISNFIDNIVIETSIY